MIKAFATDVWGQEPGSSESLVSVVAHLEFQF